MTAGRLELKYCVPERVAAHVLDVAHAYLEPEPLARGPRQLVTSLYLDTPDLRFLRWHQEGADDRYKLRIRGYGALPAATLYRELKRKTASVVRKDRKAFPADALRRVAEGCRARHGATPRTLIRGIRESLREPGGETAVTADRALQYQRTRRADLVGANGRWTALPLPPCPGSSPVLVELKFGEWPPAWMDVLIDALAPSRVSYSKYVAAMTGCAAGEAPGAPAVRCTDARRFELV